MTASDGVATTVPLSGSRRVAAALYRRPRLRLGLLLAGPVGWLVVAYLGSLAILFLNAFWTRDPFTGLVIREFTLDNFAEVATDPLYRTVTLRTVGMAFAVTLTCIVLAFPIAYYMARVASPRVRGLMVVAVLMPLWASYLVKAYSWRLILSEDGVLNWFLAPFGLRGPGLGEGMVGLWIVFTYLWLPYMILPIYAGLERIPASLLEASADLGGRSFTTFRRVVLPLAFPAVVAGSIFTFSLTLGDYIAPGLVTTTQFIGTLILSRFGVPDLPLAAALSIVPLAIMVGYLLVARRLGRLRGAVMSGRLGRGALGLVSIAVLAFMYFPLALIVVYAFNESGTSAWPPSGISLRWIALALENSGLRQAFITSLAAALGATLIALLLGTLAALAVARYQFFGREAISFVVIFPIALPGIVTGMALSTTFATTGVPLGLFAIVIGHATFCIVLVYNNAIARLRRTSASLEEASSDLGADSWQTFRRVTLPSMRSAMLAGALLAFALSFDEVIVTIFLAGGVQTLPIWIFQSFRLANQLALVNVAGLVAILLSVIPVYIATRISTGVAGART